MPARRPPADAGAAHQARLAARGERKALGAYYTPPALVAGVVDLALGPVLDRAARAGPDAIFALRIVDPSCGDGRFLVAAGSGCSARCRRSASAATRCAGGSPRAASTGSTSIPRRSASPAGAARAGR
ncbi:MAG: hypothetical protein R2702_06095 [Acidimicrobiales bacterium]